MELATVTPTIEQPGHVDAISPSSAFRTGALILVLVTATWRFWTLSQWSWYQDDWFYMALAVDMPFSDYVVQNYNGHIMPAQFAIVWLMTKMSPLAFSWAVGVNILFITAATMAWALALREIFGEKKRLLYPLAILSLSPLFMPITLWWASAIQVFPLATFMGLGVYFTARFALRGHRWVDLLAVVGVYVIGLLFWQKSLLILIPIAFVGVMLTRGRIIDAIKELRILFASLTLVVVIYVPIYLYLTRNGDASNTRLLQQRGVVESISFYIAGILDVVLPSFLGGPWTAVDNPAQRFGGSPGVRTLFFVLLAVGGTVLALKYRRRAWIPITMAIVYIVVAWGLVFTSTRYDILGQYIVRDARYAADIVPVALLALMLLTTPTRGETDPWKFSPTRSWVEPAFQATVGLTMALIVTSMFVTNGRSWDRVAQQSPKPWVDNFLRDARNAGPISIYDTIAPNNVIFSAIFAEDARLSALLKPLRSDLQFNEPAEVMYTTEWTGRLKEAEVADATRNATPVPVPDCGYIVQPGFESVIPLEVPLFDWEWGFHLDYFSAESAQLTVETENETVVLELEPGLSQRQFVVEDPVPFVRVNVSADSGTVCVTDLRVGPFKPSERGL